MGFAGAGVLVCNIDGDPFPDYIDLDTDGDGQIDRVEGNDFNFNGMADDLITLTGIDTDGDGLDDRFDNDSTSIKATSAYMGTGGTLFGQVPPGTTSVVQKKTPPQPDRDWRFVGVVLPVQFLQFTGTPQGINVLLNWVIITEKDIDRFEIERSTNNNTYTKIGTLTKAVQLNIQQGFAYTDDISGVNSDVIYYRLKVIGKAGEVKYSNVLVVRKSTIKAQVSIMPNPAKDYVAVRLYTDKDSEASFRLIDMAGKTVLIQTHKVLKGNNTVQINDLRKFSNGTYILQITVNGETTSERLILAK
ncbi:MAG: T9SS type A sorting domain-containing protein [Chitinophagaceae bacterium]|nr:T9SS type A sorting domain-containing protein [Chitinophagaceae bacterium]